MIPLTVVVAALPAASVAVPVALWLAPSLRTCGPLTLSMPDRGSVPVKETVTSSLYQSAPLGARSAAPVIDGAVLSRFTVAVPDAVLPALSVAVPRNF